jgi:hypothetical protein
LKKRKTEKEREKGRYSREGRERQKDSYSDRRIEEKA